jgi:hypothetical protein
MTTREQAMQWWESLGSASKTRLVDINTELLVKGIQRRWEKLTGREIEKIWRKETKTENTYLNRLREQYKEVQAKKIKGGFYMDGYDRTIKEYNSVRLFCLDCELVSFNDIELMEYEVNSSFSS